MVRKFNGQYFDSYPDKMLHKAFHLLKQWVEVQSFKVILAKCFQCHSVLPNA